MPIGRGVAIYTVVHPLKRLVTSHREQEIREILRTDSVTNSKTG